MKHYNDKYFDYQKSIGEFGGIANKFKFQKHIKKNTSVLDFGCGGGFLLKNIECHKKMGFEINEHAKKYINDHFNFQVVDSIENLKNQEFDVVISNHCFEHIPNPIEVLKKLKEKIKLNGKIIIYVPHDTSNYGYSSNDIDNHFYSFSPSNLGNILKESGYDVIETGRLLHRWPPFYYRIYKILGLKMFHFLSRIYGFFDRRRTQTFVVAIKK